MMVRRVKLVNVLSHENTEIDFPDGVVSIVGLNGAGKSAIVDSIYIALLSDAKDIRGGKKEFIVTRGRHRGEISVVLEVGGRTFLVVRKLDTLGSSKAYLYEIEGEIRKLRADGVSDVVREVGKLLGLPTYTEAELRRLARATIFSLQGELTRIIDIEDSKRKEWVLSLLGLSYLERALESVKGVAKEERDKLVGELTSKEGLLGKTKNNLEKLRRELIEMETKLSRYLDEKVEIDEEVRSYEDKVKLVDLAIDTALELRAAIVLKKIEELESKIKQLSALKGWNPEYYTQLTRDVSSKRRGLQEAEERLKEFLEKVRGVLSVPAEKLEGVQVEIEERIGNLREQEGGFKERAKLYGEILAKFKISDKCPVCGSKISDPEEVRERLAREIENIENALRGIGSEIRTLMEKRQLIIGALRSLSELSSELESLGRELRSREGELKRLVEKARELCHLVGIEFGEVDECVSSLSRLRDEVGRAEFEFEVLRRLAEEGPVGRPPARLEEIEQRLDSVLSVLGLRIPSDVSPEMLDRLVNVELKEFRRRLESELGKLRERSSILSGEIGRLKGSIESRKEDVENAEKAVVELEKDVKSLERRVRTLKILEDFGRSYLGKDGEIAKSLTKVVRSSLEKKTNRLLSRLGLPHIGINDEFQISVKVPGGEVPIENASGGERVGISIALRLVLAELVMGRSPTVLVVDEPTIYLDNERRESVFDIVRELGKSLRQLIVVTHDEAVTRISDKVITVESVSGVSRIVSA